METHFLLGVRVCAADAQELLDTVTSLIGIGGRVYTVNPLMLVEAWRDSTVREVLNRAQLCVPDGVGIRRSLRSRGIYTDVLCGVELGEHLLANGGSVGFVGGMPGVSEKAFQRLSEKYPLSAAFIFDGYNFDADVVARCLRTTRPTFLFVCLGTPRQEILIDRWSEASPTTLCVGLGGSFDVYAGRIGRAPRFMRLIGCEWLWRMIRQPHRVRRIPDLLRYVFLSKVEKKQIKCTKNKKRVNEK